MIFWLLLSAVLVIVDQITKALVVANMTLGEAGTIPVLGQFFRLTYVRNPGAVFGIGGDESGIPLIFFLVVGSAALIVFGIMIAKNDYKDKRRFWYSLSLSLLVAGALGNLIDRVVQTDNRVVDFLDFHGIWGYVFNFADMCLCVGIAIYLFDQFILDPKRVKQNATE
ncbi:MAG: signal peptidase II [bacterium]